ncbi:MAG: hypothetical protein IJ304_00025 [Clostridia bacterium]|nr:hypothetical protein [Clostridia bacterium]
MRKLILGLSGNQLKILAVIFMTIDHIGLHLFPGIQIFRIIGRLSFPIFAFTFAEGCKYTKNRTRHFLVLCLFAVLCQAVYTYAMNSLYQNILVTLALSALVIYAFDFAKKTRNFLSYVLAIAVLISVFFICFILPASVGRGFAIDYGFYGVMLPVLCYLGKTKQEKILLLSMGLLLLAPNIGTIQLFSLISVPIIALYNETRGKWRMKNFFYIYYPLHLVVIHFLRIFLNNQNIL